MNAKRILHLVLDLLAVLEEAADDARIHFIGALVWLLGQIPGHVAAHAHVLGGIAYDLEREGAGWGRK